MAAAAHSGSAVSVVVGLTLFVKVGSRGLEHRKDNKLFKNRRWIVIIHGRNNVLRRDQHLEYCQVFLLIYSLSF